MTSFRRKRGTYKVQEDAEHTPNKATKKKMMTCFVDLLDDNTMNIEIERQARGDVLLNETFKRLDLVEKDYFGLVYLDNQSGLTCWLESHKKIRKQNRGDHILKFRFCVKFYVTEPGKLSEEYTRYLFYLQSRQDLLYGRLHCASVTATQLASYVVQAELGDYSAKLHTDGYVSELKLLQEQTPDLEQEIAVLHHQNAGLKCDDAEYKFLEMAKRLPMYGVDLHPAIDHDNIHLQLGVMASGIVVYLKENKINSFSWAKIIKISFKKKRFYIHIRADNDDKYQSRIIGFKIVPYRACKNVWKRCVEYHTFFRLNTPRDIPPRGIMRLGSKYHYKGRTQKQALEDYNNYMRTNSSFERTPSKRNTRRKDSAPNNNHNLNNNKDNRSFYLNSNGTPSKNLNDQITSPDFVSPTSTSSPHHASTPSDMSNEDAAPHNARFEYDTNTGEINVNLDSTLNTSTPSVNLLEEREEEEDMDEITIMPDAAGKFGFNVRGGFDQKIPVVVSKVARGSPAAAAIPCLEENDQVISINHTAVETLAHNQIVAMIQSSSTQFGKLTLVVRKNNSDGRSGKERGDGEMDHTRDSHSFELPELPKYNAETANLLDRSITILQKSLQDGSLMNKFNNLYRQTPGVTMVSAKLDENHSKNRFRDTVPYDTTRVRLQEGNDYINASYVDVPIGSDQLSYIASQGPMSSTIDDHWQMIWEQEVELVVMVVECIEKNSVKCSQYWPEPTQTAVYNNNVEVRCISQTELDGGIEREFEVTQDGINKSVTHLQYTTWPHHGTPEEPNNFVNFVKLIKERRRYVETPVLVHCSTGIGRTGVVILLESALHLIQSKSGVYPLDMVQALRDQRPKLIQNFPLFKFACESVLYLYSEETSKEAEDKEAENKEGEKETEKSLEEEEEEASQIEEKDEEFVKESTNQDNNNEANLIQS